MNPSRQDEVEHRLAGLVQRWAEARQCKTDAMKAHNEEIRQIEADIDGVLRELRDLETGQQALPFQGAVVRGVPVDEPLPPVDDGVICMACGVRHRRTGAMTCVVCADAGRVWVPDARDPGYVVEVSDANDQAG